jgi:lipid-A-disaccharide synthase
MEAADATIVASGTASLEVALYKKPSIISYQTSWLSAKIYPHVALQPWIGLPNILMRSHFIPEVLQNEATVQGLADALTNEIERYAKDASVHEQLTQMHESLIADTPNLCVQAIEQVRTRVN